MKVNFKKDCQMVKVCLKLKMEQFIMELGKMINRKAKELKNGQMGQYIKVYLEME